MAAYYNEIEPYAAEWLRQLIKAGHIADGVVDTRSIEDIHPIELHEFTQCHFFAGIGVWSRALRLAGWPDERRVWTGSCPCQPFSTAGKGAGFDDERHLWPAFFHLIEECRPSVVFGEQVASKDGLQWLDLVRADLEGSGYTAGAADLCAAGVGAPHIRQRLYWVADAAGPGSQGGGLARGARPGRQGASAERDGADGGLADHDGPGLGIRRRTGCGGARDAGSLPGDDGDATGRLADDHEGGRAQLGQARLHDHRQPGHDAAGCGADERLADAGGARVRDRGRAADAGTARGAEGAGSQRQWLWDDAGHDDHGGAALEPAAGPTHGHWADADWLFCRDGKWRPVEPGTFPLAHGAAARVGRLRAYGNAIVAQVAQTFIEAYLDTRG